MGCGGSKPLDGDSPTGSGSNGKRVGFEPANGHSSSSRAPSSPGSDSFNKRREQQKRREGISSGKNENEGETSVKTTGKPKTDAEVEKMRGFCGTNMLFSSMTLEQQKEIFDAMVRGEQRAPRNIAARRLHVLRVLRLLWWLRGARAQLGAG